MSRRSSILLDTLSSLPRFGTGVGLHRVRHLLDALPSTSWLEGVDAIKVTGSNGKGSVAMMTAAILRRLGIDAGLYTSPHVSRFAERIQVQGAPVSAADLDASAAWLRGVLEAWARRHPDDRMGAFEALTAAAMHCFESLRPPALVAEAGIGGRYDPVRWIPGRLAALVSVDREHTEILGETAELRAYDKADLCPPEGTLVVGDLGEDLERRLEAYCRLRKVGLVRAGHGSGAVRYEGSRMRVDLRVSSPEGPDLEIPSLGLRLVGRHQATNAAVAVSLAREWLRRQRPEVGDDELCEAVRRALGEVAWPGRMERWPGSAPKEPDVWLDVGHTPEAVEAVAEAMRGVCAGRKPLLLAGVSRGRDAGTLLAPLASVVEGALVTGARHRSQAPSEVAEALARVAPQLAVTVMPDLASALEAARQWAREEGRPVLVTGSFFLVAEVRALLAGEDPEELEALF